jgi:hypothetical protein
MAGIGIAKKGLGLLKQAFKSRGREPGVLDKVIGKGVVDRNVKSKEVFKTIQGLRKKPYKGAKKNLDKIYKKKGIDYKKIAIKTAPIGGAAAAGVAYGERKGKK